MQWTDIYDIAIELADTHEDLDPQGVRFTELSAMVMALPDFDDDPTHGGEKILEAIQQAWIEEQAS